MGGGVPGINGNDNNNDANRERRTPPIAGNGERQLHQRIDHLEERVRLDVAALQRDQARLEARLGTLQEGVTTIVQSTAAIQTDLHWIKDGLDKKVDKAGRDSSAAQGSATAANVAASTAAGRSYMAVTISIIAALVAIIAGLLGIRLPLGV